MLGYLIRRLVSSLVVLFLVSFMTFALFFEAPTNPVEDLCVAHGVCTPAKFQAIEHQLGYDKGLIANYEAFVGGLFHDRTIDYGGPHHCDAPCLGISFHSQTEVSKDLLKYYPATFSLALGGAALFLLLGLGTGTIAALRRGTTTDRVVVAASQVVSSVPYPVLAVIAFIYLTLKYDVFPATGYHSFLHNPIAWAGGLLLPWVMLGIDGAPDYARYARGQFLEAQGEDFVRTARAKGVSRFAVVYRHAWRAAIVPIVTLFGMDLAGLLSGTIFTEAIFHIDGIGAWTLNSLRAPTDFPIMNATILVYAVLIIVGNLVVDLLYALLDPRVRLV